MASLRSGWAHAHVLHGALLGGIAAFSMCSSIVWHESCSDRKDVVYDMFQIKLRKKRKKKEQNNKETLHSVRELALECFNSAGLQGIIIAPEGVSLRG